MESVFGPRNTPPPHPPPLAAPLLPVRHLSGLRGSPSHCPPRGHMSLLPSPCTKSVPVWEGEGRDRDPDLEGRVGPGGRPGGPGREPVTTTALNLPAQGLRMTETVEDREMVAVQARTHPRPGLLYQPSPFPVDGGDWGRSRDGSLVHRFRTRSLRGPTLVQGESGVSWTFCPWTGGDWEWVLFQD